MTTSESLRIQPLTLTQLGPAVRVLSRAFDQYPLLRYCFAEQADAYAELMMTMFRLTLSRRIVYEGVTLGVSHGSALAGVAGVSLPDHGAMPEAMRAAGERFSAAMGPAAHERFGAYGAIVARHRPQAPHLFLGVLGVQPFLHGMGYGRALLDAVHAMAAAHPTAQGVYLDTEHAANVDLYRHFGYELLGEDRVGPVGVWCLYRPNSAA
jgi:GNAT superfamily N-acetyltransferase